MILAIAYFLLRTKPLINGMAISVSVITLVISLCEDLAIIYFLIRSTH